MSYATAAAQLREAPQQPVRVADGGRRLRSDGSSAAALRDRRALGVRPRLLERGRRHAPGEHPARARRRPAAHTSRGRQPRARLRLGRPAPRARAGSSTTAAYGSHTTLRQRVEAHEHEQREAQARRTARSRISGRRIAATATAANAKNSGPNHPRSVVGAPLADDAAQRVVRHASRGSSRAGRSRRASANGATSATHAIPAWRASSRRSRPRSAVDDAHARSAAARARTPSSTLRGRSPTPRAAG